MSGRPEEDVQINNVPWASQDLEKGVRRGRAGFKFADHSRKTPLELEIELRW